MVQLPFLARLRGGRNIEGGKMEVQEVATAEIFNVVHFI
jgi:hypothetical protein